MRIAPPISTKGTIGDNMYYFWIGFLGAIALLWSVLGLRMLRGMAGVPRLAFVRWPVAVEWWDLQAAQICCASAVIAGLRYVAPGEDSRLQFLAKSASDRLVSDSHAHRTNWRVAGLRRLGTESRPLLPLRSK